MKIVRVILLAGIIAVIFAGCSSKSNKTFDADKWINAWVKMWNTYDLNQVDN
jgi:hypothetical protein